MRRPVADAKSTQGVPALDNLNKKSPSSVKGLKISRASKSVYKRNFLKGMHFYISLINKIESR
jgi:hypothetical protein